jgi:hypothetical protein
MPHSDDNSSGCGYQAQAGEERQQEGQSEAEERCVQVRSSAIVLVHPIHPILSEQRGKLAKKAKTY